MSNHKFGPQTGEVAGLLAFAERVSSDNMSAMLAAYDSEAATNAAQNAIHSNGKVDEQEMGSHMMLLQLLQMAGQHYPAPVVNAALGVAKRHKITPEDYETLTAPWKAAGLPLAA